MDLRPEGQPARRAVPAWIEEGWRGPRRHARRFQARRPSADQAQGDGSERRDFRVVRPRCGAVGELPRPRDHALLRSRLRWTQADGAGLFAPAHPQQLEADAGEHQGSLPRRPAAHLVRGVWSDPRRPEVPARDGCAWPPWRHGLDPRERRQGRCHQGATQLQGGHDAARRPDRRHQARALVERPDGGHADAVPKPDRPAAVEQHVHTADHAAWPGLFRFRLDPLRVRGGRPRYQVAPPAAGQHVRAGRLRVGRRR